MYIHVITISEVVNMWCMPRKTLVSTSNPDTKVELSLKQTTKQKQYKININYQKRIAHNVIFSLDVVP
jgi:Leu/Phe-tRNA-protein transferase